MEQRMTDLITEARELCEKASPGPWTRTGTRMQIVDSALSIDGTDIKSIVCDVWSNNDDDAAFIARSRTLIPKLCDALEKAEAEIEKMKPFYKIADDTFRHWENAAYAMRDDERKKHRWIPVSERLPENGRYLTCSVWYGKQMINIDSFSTGRSKVDAYDMRGLGAGFYNYHSESGYFPVDDITHWMPLPAAPEEGGEK